MESATGGEMLNDGIRGLVRVIVNGEDARILGASDTGALRQFSASDSGLGWWLSSGLRARCSDYMS